MSRIYVSGSGALALPAPSERARVLSQLFPVPSGRSPAAPALQIVGADLDHDGDQDKYYLQLLPLTPVAGLSFAAGEVKDLELKPLRLFQAGVLAVEPALAAKFIITAFSVGQENQLVAQGGVPMSAFAANSTYRTISGQLAGPGVPITMSIKNIDAAVQVLYGVWFGQSIVG